MTKLSPTAQAVLNAANGACSYGPDDVLNDSRQIAAAAIRAVADLVVPDEHRPSANKDFHLNNWTKHMDQYYQRQQTRVELLAIAAELEGTLD